MPTLKLPSPRQEMLLNYLREVAKDLVTRGMLRFHKGDTIISILQQEPAKVLESIVKDLSEAGLSVKNEVIGGVVQAAMRAIFK